MVISNTIFPCFKSLNFSCILIHFTVFYKFNLVYSSYILIFIGIAVIVFFISFHYVTLFYIVLFHYVPLSLMFVFFTRLLRSTSCYSTD
jgi:hypothetical protein